MSNITYVPVPEQFKGKIVGIVRPGGITDTNDKTSYLGLEVTLAIANALSRANMKYMVRWQEKDWCVQETFCDTLEQADSTVATLRKHHWVSKGRISIFELRPIPLPRKEKA